MCVQKCVQIRAQAKLCAPRPEELAMHGRHLRQRGRWWHYYRNRPKRYESVEARQIITFALHTCCISEAKVKAAQISRDLENKWDTALERRFSLENLSTAKRYSAAIEINKNFGLSTIEPQSMSDQELLTRLRLLMGENLSQPEQKAILGFVEKPSLTLMDAFDRFWAHIEDEWTGLSHDQRRCKRNVYLKSIRHFEEAVGSISFYNISKTHALEFRSWWMDRKKKNGLKSCTANREIDSVRRMIRVNFDIDSCEDKNPFDRVRLKKDVKVRRSPISTELIRENILAPGKLDGLHTDFQLLVRLIVNTGMRPIEAIGLELEDFILDHEIPHVHVRQNAVRVLKTPHSERLLPLLGESLNAAQKIHSQGGWGNRLGKNMYATTVINRHFKANDTFVAEKQSFYSLRHWFQDQLTQRGVVDRIQCQLMGHKFNRPTYGDGAPLSMLKDVLAEFAI